MLVDCVLCACVASSLYLLPPFCTVLGPFQGLVCHCSSVIGRYEKRKSETSVSACQPHSRQATLCRQETEQHAIGRPCVFIFLSAIILQQPRLLIHHGNNNVLLTQRSRCVFIFLRQLDKRLCHYFFELFVVRLGLANVHLTVVIRSLRNARTHNPASASAGQGCLLFPSNLRKREQGNSFTT